MPEKRKLEADVVITSITSPGKIAEVAKIHGLNPQEVFVRVSFRIADSENTTEYKASNKLRFLTAKGYERLLESKKESTAINVTLSKSEDQDEAFIYVNPEENVSIEDLFSIPVEKEDNRADIFDLMDTL